MSEPQHAEPATVRRAMWLLGVPIGSTLLPLAVLARSSPGAFGMLLIGAIPLIGGLGALSYSFVAPVRMWPLVAYIAGAAVFVFLVLVSVNMTSGTGLDFGPVKVVGLALPVLALAGGLVCYAWLPEPEPAWESEQEPELEPGA
jgi:hypothetical protein